MENLTFLPRIEVFRECSQTALLHFQEANQLQESLASQKNCLRRIDPRLVDESRVYSDDWFFTRLVKNVYYLVQRYFSESRITRAQEEIRRIEEVVQLKTGLEGRVTAAFNRSFQCNPVINTFAELQDQFKTFTRFHDRIDVFKETNAFLNQSELEGFFPEGRMYQCKPIFREESNLFQSCCSGVSSDASDDCSQVSALTREEEVEEEPTSLRTSEEMTVETLFSDPKLYEVTNSFLPLSQVKSIESLGEDAYRLNFGGPVIGRVEKLEDGFAEALEGIVRRRLQMGSNILANLRENYPSVATFLDTIKVQSLADFTGVVYWEGLLGAWGAAGGSYCHLPESVTLKVMESKVEVLESNFRAGFHLTDFHLIKQNLLNRAFQAALYTLLKGFGLVTIGGYTKKPLHSTFCINHFQRSADREGVLIHMTGVKDNEIEFEYDQSWQQPQNFSEEDLEALKASPMKCIHQEELSFIGKHLVWRREGPA